jgi:hypothetical protein
LTLVDVRFGLVQLLTSDPGVNGVIQGRVYPVKMKQGVTLDSLVYNRITELEPYTMLGPSGLVSARYQFDAWSRSADSATALANLVKELFGGFRGLIAINMAAPMDHVDVQLIEVVNGRDDWDQEAQMYNVSKDYFIWYEERNA